MPGHNTTDTRPTPLVHKGHTSSVYSVAFAPDGNSLASGSWDRTVRTWDAYTPSAIGQPLTGHTGSVHELMGVVLFKGQSLGMVSEWMDNGNLHEYLRKHPDVNRYQLSVQVASGIAYIHTFGMVHGDIKALNVLISSNGHAKLTGFGLSTMSESSLEFSATTSQAGSIRWVSPEQLLQGSPRSMPSDVYALGMTLLEIFTGTMPYYPQCARDYQVLVAVQQGTLPTRPMNRIKDDMPGNRIWSLLVNCWDREPDGRPSATEVVDSLTEISAMKGQTGK